MGELEAPSRRCRRREPAVVFRFPDMDSCLYRESIKARAQVFGVNIHPAAEQYLICHSTVETSCPPVCAFGGIAPVLAMGRTLFGEGERGGGHRGSPEACIKFHRALEGIVCSASQQPAVSSLDRTHCYRHHTHTQTRAMHSLSAVILVSLGALAVSAQSTAAPYGQCK